MSGDVQPRKRKDKRRKKEEEDSGTPPPTLVNPAESLSENVTIHVYKESSTGGHWCARIVFFALLALFVGLIGIIIFEHRGTTDVDTPLESSRWAFVFDGWVDDTPPSHEEVHDEKDDEEHSEEVELEEGEVDGEHGDEADSVEAEVSKEDDDGEHDEEDEEEVDVEKESGEEEEYQEEEEDEEEQREEEEEEDETAQEREEYISTELNDDEDDDITQEQEDEDRDFDSENFDDSGVLEEVNPDSEEQDVDDEQNVLDETENEFDVSTEADNILEDAKDEVESEEFLGIPGVNEIDDDNAEPLEEIEGLELEENVNDVEVEPEVEEIEEEPVSVAVKFGVGVALVVAAHFVLVRRWNNADLENSDDSEVPDLSRRNTMVPPPHIKEVISTIDNQKPNPAQKQAENYEELRTKYNKLGIEGSSKNVSVGGSFRSNIESGGKIKNWSAHDPSAEVNKAREQAKVISSEEDEQDDDEELETSEGERISGTEEYEYEDGGEDEEEDEEMEDEEEEDEIENVDDLELIAKLEAKYGKLPTPQDTEEEEEEEEDIEDEEDEDIEEEEEVEEDEDIEGWKRVKAPKASAGNLGSTLKSNEKTEIKTKQGDITKNVGGARTHSYNVSNFDEIIVREESD